MNIYIIEGNYLANIDVQQERDGGALVSFYRARGSVNRVWMSEERLNKLHKQLTRLGYNLYPIWQTWQGLVSMTYTNRNKPYAVAYGAMVVETQAWKNQCDLDHAVYLLHQLVDFDDALNDDTKDRARKFLNR